MGRVHIHRINVEFGDCDPAQIAFYPNFFRWYDSASRHFFESCGVPPWRDLERAVGIIGTPVVEASSRFIRPTSYGDMIEVHTSTEEWRDKSFVMKYELRRDGELLAEGRDIRIFESATRTTLPASRRYRYLKTSGVFASNNVSAGPWPSGHR